MKSIIKILYISLAVLLFFGCDFHFGNKDSKNDGDVISNDPNAITNTIPVGPLDPNAVTNTIPVKTPDPNSVTNNIPVNPLDPNAVTNNINIGPPDPNAIHNTIPVKDPLPVTTLNFFSSGSLNNNDGGVTFRFHPSDEDIHDHKMEFNFPISNYDVTTEDGATSVKNLFSVVSFGGESITFKDSTGYHLIPGHRYKFTFTHFQDNIDQTNGPWNFGNIVDEVTDYNGYRHIDSNFLYDKTTDTLSFKILVGCRDIAHCT